MVFKEEVETVRSYRDVCYHVGPCFCDKFPWRKLYLEPGFIRWYKVKFDRPFDTDEELLWELIECSSEVNLQIVFGLIQQHNAHGFSVDHRHEETSSEHNHRLSLWATSQSGGKWS